MAFSPTDRDDSPPSRRGRWLHGQGAGRAAIQNVVDLTRAVRALLQEGYPVRREDLAALSPYQTGHLERFGDYTLAVRPPEPFDGELVTPFRLEPPAEPPGAVA
jgi:hypothetical protein